MTRQRHFLQTALARGAGQGPVLLGGGPLMAESGRFAFTLSDAEWKRRLLRLACRMLRHEAPERSFSSPLDGERRKGIHVCAGCDLLPLRWTSGACAR